MHLFPFSLQCSYYPPCKSSRIANEKAVHDYEQKFGTPGKTYPCLYNPHNPKEVIRTRRFHLSHVIHGMVWSSLVFLISLGILIFAVKKKGCDFVWVFSSSCLVQLSTAFFRQLCCKLHRIASNHGCINTFLSYILYVLLYQADFYNKET